MIDRGMLLSFAIIASAVWLTARRWPPRLTREESVLGAGSSAVIAGIVAARLVAVVIDDPSALNRFRDLLIIRGGMEFWPGVAAGVAALAVAARRSGVPVVAELADLAPYGLVGYAAYEATCLLRDGCFGPVSPVGLRPGGLGATELPIGLFVAAGVAVLAVVVRQIGHRDLAVALAVVFLGVGAVRSVAAVWLPKIGPAPTRPQLESAAVTLAAAVALGWLLAVKRRDRKQLGPPGSATGSGAVAG